METKALMNLLEDTGEERTVRVTIAGVEYAVTGIRLAGDDPKDGRVYLELEPVVNE